MNHFPYFLIYAILLYVFRIHFNLIYYLKGGETGSTGVIEALAACRGSYRLVKKVGKHIIADDYNYALAA